MISLRTARPEDAAAVAALHADSWRRHYRGAYSDAFLDGDVTSDRLAVWSTRLSDTAAPTATILAEADGELVGFAHTVMDDDPTWGSLLDNLHVSFAAKRGGIGTRLLAATGRAVIQWMPQPRLYLWVLEQNVAAQAFYRSRGGELADKRPVSAPGGIADRLAGTPSAWRCVWPDPSVLLV